MASGSEAIGAGALRTIPSKRIVLSTSPANLSQFGNQFVWMRSTGGDVTMLRTVQTVTAGQGFVLKNGDPAQELYIDKTADMMLSFTGGSIEVLYDG